MRFEGRTLRASVAAYEAWVGPRNGLWVLHKCDNPPCINPDHLFLGDVGDNVRDMWEKGRGVAPVLKGSTSPSSKLNEADVRCVRELLIDGISLAEIGRMFGVTRQAIFRIKKGLSWRTT